MAVDWEQRKSELSSLIVDQRKHTHRGPKLGDVVQVGAVTFFPAREWQGLRYHERRYVEVKAAAMESNAAVLLGRSAARIHGMWVVATTEEKIEITSQSGSAPPSRLRSGRFVYRYTALREDEVSLVDGCRVTRGIRTFADIARFHGFEEGLVAVDSLLRRGFTTEMVAAELGTLGRLRNIKTVRECLRHATALSDSPYESYARALLIAAGILGIEVQVEIRGYRVDLLIDGWLVIEIDGNVKYDGPDAERVRQAEFLRQKRVGNEGFYFLRYAPEYIRRNPRLFVDEVKSTLETLGDVYARLHS